MRLLLKHKHVFAINSEPKDKVHAKRNNHKSFFLQNHQKSYKNSSGSFDYGSTLANRIILLVSHRIRQLGCMLCHKHIYYWVNLVRLVIEYCR
jgi:hypothetical protein